MKKRYRGFSEVINRRAERYTENRTTAFRESDTDIFGVGTN
jgi:hypothetical protein